MTQSFDKWYDNNEHYHKYDACKSAYKAGAQSRQEEVDKIKSEVDELQKRIDKALVQISNHYHSCAARKDLKRMSVSISEIAEIEAHESNMCVLENILKGNQDEMV